MAEYPYTESGSFQVRPHRPGRTLAVSVILLLGVLFGGWWLYELGRDHGGYESRMSRATEARLRIQIDDLRSRVTELADQRTLLERSRRIDEATFQRLESRLEQREQHIGHLEEELAFYRSLVSSADAESGLTVERFSLYPDGAREYRFEIVLTRLDHDDTEAGGSLDLTIEGLRAGESVELAYADLVVDGDPELGFRFKYFQALAGRLRLPDDVDPERVRLAVEPEDDEIGSVEEDYSWNSLVTGGT